MRGKLHTFATFSITVAGVPFRVRRRTAELMLQIGDPRAVFGLMAGATKAAAAGDEQAAAMLAEANAEYVRMQHAAAPLVLVEIDGDPVDPHNPPAWEDVAVFMDAIFEAFLSSGLDADPMPGSCEAQQEPKQPSA